jgi:hypothetical protein
MRPDPAFGAPRLGVLARRSRWPSERIAGTMRFVPMDAFPTLDDLFWLFEVEPRIEEPDVGWPISAAIYTTTRGRWQITVGIEPYLYFVRVVLSHQGVETVRLELDEVETVAVDRGTHGIEALVVTFAPPSSLKPLRMTLKPVVSLALLTKRAWE